jgi:hypothetical protein
MSSNARKPTSDTDSVVELRDDNSILDVFKGRKNARSSHIWLLENGVEYAVDGAVTKKKYWLEWVPGVGHARYLKILVKDYPKKIKICWSSPAKLKWLA